MHTPDKRTANRHREHDAHGLTDTAQTSTLQPDATLWSCPCGWLGWLKIDNERHTNVTMEISNRLPDVDNVEWQATVMLGLDEETLTLDLPQWSTTEEVQEAFIAEAQNVYWLDSPAVVLEMRGPDGTLY